MTEITDTIPVTVRFFAAARDAAGTETATLALQQGSTLSDAIRELSGQSDRMALVLRKCSFLSDGVAVRDRATVLLAHQTLDVLPPFAGG
ncbi:MoaD/ThiS family protein [Mycolicibacterium sp.]|uniref:MoaD/ThiS family protein n=1 Tax=Mycolicibacterium sp. TaxID=2320850 RepID=UPI001D3EB9D8|nr:MoaD/ThiS family protein [Mycolicibacterium sp.]MCB1290689.1 MoaD/ThiS family protein [Mycobacterium sp.]MCB9410436.1 MoaD/ThiS family protein [Mycolicibacterium sp.]